MAKNVHISPALHYAHALQGLLVDHMLFYGIGKYKQHYAFMLVFTSIHKFSKEKHEKTDYSLTA